MWALSMHEAALVNPMTAICLNHRVEWLHDDVAADHSLVRLVSGYTLAFFVVAAEVRGCDRVRSARKPDDCDMSESPG
ncbi:hypothetical protein TU86_01090 [Pseudomonas weihenstephanensis]|uniref:Uncharacterized protein n=1 Tax=Pseudomonas weihenstephanensis TaxID=1608994 RepID=A0A0J6LM21_9PSED|nr:hypothetical protein TU86_01090 [Pseudomonas weihenstephanensis]KMN18109.1 hypothetical protein TU87_12220 [Pseudomonas weihenstephanensis]